MKNKHRIKQCLSLLLAGGIALTNLGAVMPAFAEDAHATPETAEATTSETAEAATPETAEANVPTPNLLQITENLYDDLPDAPTGSYLGSMGLPVATGETKISISAWVSDLYLHNSRYRAAPDCRCRRYEGLSAYRFSRFRRRWAG